MSSGAVEISLLAMLVFGLGVWYSNHLNRKRGEDAQDRFWANIAVPLVYFTQDIDDEGCSERFVNAKKRLIEAGNKYLKLSDIHCFVWGADEFHEALDFATWRAEVLVTEMKIQEEFRAAKAKHAKEAAAELLGRQVRAADFDKSEFESQNKENGRSKF